MNPSPVTISLEDVPFRKLVEDFAVASMRGFRAVFMDECCELAGELVKRTPPFSGKALRKMLDVQDQRRQISQAESYGPFVPKGFNDPDIESLSAKRIGERRVEKDIKRVIFGVRGAAMPKAAQVFKGQDSHKAFGKGAVTDWGIYQKCQGRDAVRIFATKKGEVYGVDFERFKANATKGELRQVHQAHRGARGRVSMAGSRDRVIGRWKWLDVLVTKESIVNRFIKEKKKMVGQGKGGWAQAFIQLGGRMSRSGWIGRHAARAGSCEIRDSGSDLSVTMTNRSAWASGGDPERIRSAAIAGRARALTIKTRNVLEGIWGNKARRNSEATLKHAA